MISIRIIGAICEHSLFFYEHEQVWKTGGYGVMLQLVWYYNSSNSQSAWSGTVVSH